MTHSISARHPSAGRDPSSKEYFAEDSARWIPAYAGMTECVQPMSINHG